MRENLRTSQGINIKITEKKENQGPAVEDISGKGIELQYRADALVQDVFEHLRGIWNAYFGEEESASLLNQFIGNS